MSKQQEILEKSGLNWKVLPVDIMTVTGIEIPNRMALVREDTSHVLGIHSKTYDPYQNEELLDLLHKITDKTGLEFHSGGMFDNGEKVFFQLKSNDHRIGGDLIEGYITGINSFDGSTSLGFGNYDRTVSCRNSFWRGYSFLDNKLRHSQNMRPKIEQILKRIDLLLEEEKVIFNTIDKFNDVRITPEIREMVMNLMFDLEGQEKKEDISTRKLNLINKFEIDLGIEMSTKGDNLWGLFSGVTRYTTHSMKEGDNSKSKIVGVAGRKERQIWNELSVFI
jgi:hypothetical protein